MELFFERGYDAVTVTDIAERAGMTKGSFFNHFGDKPEVVFATLDTFARDVVANLTVTGAQNALEATVSAFAKAATELDQPDQARAVRALIGSSPMLQERERTKMAVAARTIGDALTAQGLRMGDALFVAHTATLVFTTAYENWSTEPTTDLSSTVRATLDDFLQAVEASGELRNT